MEKYGTLEISKEYLDKNQLEKWIQLFLRNDGHNVALADGSFYVCDGRHRLEMYRQKKVKTVPAIVWTTGGENFKRLQEIIKC